MKINESALNKGELRKLNALRKSIGVNLGEEAFSKWFAEKARANPAKQNDPVAEKIAEALKPFVDDKSFKLGNSGYRIRRAKGKNAEGFIAEKIVK